MKGIRETVARAMRGAKGMTQGEEAIQVGVHRTVIGRAESGHMTDDLFDSIIDACGGAPAMRQLIDALDRALQWYESRKRTNTLLYA